MSSSLRSGSVSSNSCRHSGLAREIRCAAGPVRHTLSSQIQSKPMRGQAIELGVGNVVERRPAGRVSRDHSVSQTRVLIW